MKRPVAWGRGWLPWGESLGSRAKGEQREDAKEKLAGGAQEKIFQLLRSLSDGCDFVNGWFSTSLALGLAPCSPPPAPTGLRFSSVEKQWQLPRNPTKTFLSGQLQVPLTEEGEVVEFLLRGFSFFLRSRSVPTPGRSAEADVKGTELWLRGAFPPGFQPKCICWGLVSEVPEEETEDVCFAGPFPRPHLSSSPGTQPQAPSPRPPSGTNCGLPSLRDTRVGNLFLQPSKPTSSEPCLLGAWRGN